ncbi:hypothetical protein J7E62_02480 [Variovorax paradoxus]|nr:hypothetical protein [Variovorax paradoxus]
MAQRLQELAENPLPTPTELAKEFGIQWSVRVGSATTGGSPITEYLATTVAKPLTLKFTDVPNYSSVSLRDWGSQKSVSLTFDPRVLCVRNYQMEKELSKPQWVYRKRRHPISNHSITNYHESVQGEQIVQVYLLGTGCLDAFTVIRYASGTKPDFLGEEQ